MEQFISAEERKASDKLFKVARKKYNEKLATICKDLGGSGRADSDEVGKVLGKAIVWLLHDDHRDKLIQNGIKFGIGFRLSSDNLSGKWAFILCDSDVAPDEDGKPPQISICWSRKYQNADPVASLPTLTDWSNIETEWTSIEFVMREMRLIADLARRYRKIRDSYGYWELMKSRERAKKYDEFAKALETM